MAHVTNSQLLRRVSLFAQVSDQTIELISGNCVKRRYRRGQLIIEEGSLTAELVVLVAGRACVSRRERGAQNGDKQVILAYLGAGDYVGEMSLIDGEPHSATVSAESQLDAFVIHQADLIACMNQEPGLALSMLRQVVHRLRTANQKIEQLALKDVSHRVIDALYELACVRESGEWVISGKVSRQTVAKMVGASREMVSRVMKELEQAAVVTAAADGSLRLSQPGGA